MRSLAMSLEYIIVTYYSALFADRCVVSLLLSDATPQSGWNGCEAVTRENASFAFGSHSLLLLVSVVTVVFVYSNIEFTVYI